MLSFLQAESARACRQAGEFGVIRASMRSVGLDANSRSSGSASSVPPRSARRPAAGPSVGKVQS